MQNKSFQTIRSFLQELNDVMWSKQFIQARLEDDRRHTPIKRERCWTNARHEAYVLNDDIPGPLMSIQQKDHSLVMWRWYPYSNNSDELQDITSKSFYAYRYTKIGGYYETPFCSRVTQVHINYILLITGLYWMHRRHKRIMIRLYQKHYYIHWSISMMYTQMSHHTYYWGLQDIIPSYSMNPSNPENTM